MKKQLWIACLLLSAMSQAQPSFQWAKQAGGTGTDQGNAVATDASGNVYITGYFKGTADFDPGAGTYTLSSGNVNFSDIFISKLDASGNFLWAASMGIPNSDDAGEGITVDAAGNVYVTGSFNGTTDFDPGPGTFTLTAAATDVFVLKLNTNGNFVWAGQLSGAGSEYGYDIAVDGAGNVYTTGFFNGTTDFDPGTGVFNVISNGSIDAFISKLDANGNFVWARNVGGANTDVGYAITVDAGGNVYTTGSFKATADLDPSASTYTVATGGGTDIFISKLDASGNFVWGKSMRGSSTSNSCGRGIKADASGNVYTGGFYSGTTDFDPGVGTYTLSSGSLLNGVISKLDASGNFVWAKEIIGNGASTVIMSIALDASGNVYAGGSFDSATDFDPGAATYTLAPLTNSEDAYLLRWDASGNFGWVRDIAKSTTASNSISLNGIAVNPVSGNAFATGYFDSATSFDFDAGTTTLTPSGSWDVYVTKAGQAGFCTAPAAPVNTTPAANLTLCSGNTTTLSVSSSGSVSWYPSPTSATALATGTTYITPALAAGSYTYYAEAGTCTVSASRTAINVSVNATPTITVNSGSVCSGSSFTISPSGASTYTISGGSAVVSPATSSSYTVTGNSAAGCVSAGAISSVTVNPIPVISVNNGSVCSGDSYTITPSGASSYTYSTGIPVVSPTITATSSATVMVRVTGSNAAGCVSAQVTCSITAYALPSVSVASSNTLICIGSQALLTASGASTYSWNTGATTRTISVSPASTTSYTVSGTSNATGCSNTAAVTQSVSACTSITELSSDDFRVYPNPNSGSFTISPASAYTTLGITIADATGRLLYKQNFPYTGENHSISLTDYAPGAYFLMLNYDDRQTIKKLIIE